MDTRKLPPIEILHQRFSYCAETGRLLHRPKVIPPKIRRSTAENKTRWNNLYANTEVGSPNGDGGHLRVRIMGRNYYVHRIIWLMIYGEEPNGIIDHLNGCPADNRLENLRDTTSSQNSRNKSRSPRDLPKGVSKAGSRFRALAKLNGVYHSLGCFGTVEEAANARADFDHDKGFTLRHQMLHGA